MPLSYAIPTKIVTAWPQDQDGEPGYAVQDADGAVSWSPKALVDESWLPVGYLESLNPHEQRHVAHMEQMIERADQLEAFMETERYAGLTEDEQELMRAKKDILGIYIGVLIEQIEQSTIDECEDQDEDDAESDTE